MAPRALGCLRVGCFFGLDAAGKNVRDATQGDTHLSRFYYGSPAFSFVHFSGSAPFLRGLYGFEFNLAEPYDITITEFSFL